jgi:hypothetical protein
VFFRRKDFNRIREKTKRVGLMKEFEVKWELRSDGYMEGVSVPINTKVKAILGGDAMTKLSEFVKDKEFGSDSGVEKFPEGETSLGLLSDVEVETKTIQQSDGSAKERYVLGVGDKRYWAGVQVMQGIKTVQEQGAVKAKVVRSGSTMNDTKYIVVKEE